MASSIYLLLLLLVELEINFGAIFFVNFLANALFDFLD